MFESNNEICQRATALVERLVWARIRERWTNSEQMEELLAQLAELREDTPAQVANALLKSIPIAAVRHYQDQADADGFTLSQLMNAVIDIVKPWARTPLSFLHLSLSRSGAARVWHLS